MGFFEKRKKDLPKCHLVLMTIIKKKFHLMEFDLPSMYESQDQFSICSAIRLNQSAITLFYTCGQQFGANKCYCKVLLCF